MNFQYWIRKAKNILTESETPNLDAKLLLEFVTGKSYKTLFAFDEISFKEEEEDLFIQLLMRRNSGEPIAYITGECEFWSLPLYVSKATMIPRSDTECLVEQALSRLPRDKNSCILDLGTGTGAIALAIAKERPNCNVTAVDLIIDAITLAKRNVNRLSINNISLLQSDWYSNIMSLPLFDMVVSNPPYIHAYDPHLSKGGVSFEPLVALVSDKEGMADIDHIIVHTRRYLVKGGYLLLEHSWIQGESVRNSFIRSGYHHIKTYRDYSGNERLTIGNIQ